jgi:hypothetical protein
MVGISNTRRAVLATIVLDCITVAARAGGTTPNYDTLQAAVREHGHKVDCPTLRAVLTGLEDLGLLVCEGPKHKRSYALPTSEATVPPAHNGDRMPRQLMTEEEWRERFRRPDGTLAQYEDYQPRDRVFTRVAPAPGAEAWASSLS